MLAAAPPGFVVSDAARVAFTFEVARDKFVDDAYPLVEPWVML